MIYNLFKGYKCGLEYVPSYGLRRMDFAIVSRRYRIAMNYGDFTSRKKVAKYNMVERLLRGKTRKKSLVLMERDLLALLQLYLHRTVTSTQLARLCFSDISYETARKRLRRLQQAGFTGCSSSGRMEGRGRPELIYFLTTAGARALEQHRGISWEEIPTGPPHTYHKEHFLRLVDVRLALEEAQFQSYIENLEFTTGREFWKELSGDIVFGAEQADATIAFRYPHMESLRILLEIDTGNFRQTRHWEPKMRAFLRTGFPIWVVTGSAPRIMTLQKWTQPLLEEASVGPGKCVFAVYDDLVERGIFGAVWQRTDGSVTDLRPKLADGTRS